MWWWLAGREGGREVGKDGGRVSRIDGCARKEEVDLFGGREGGREGGKEGCK